MWWWRRRGTWGSCCDRRAGRVRIGGEIARLPQLYLMMAHRTDNPQSRLDTATSLSLFDRWGGDGTKVAAKQC
jgi:hypothetical protein